MGDWRRENVNILIRDVYSAIKAADASIRFGISLRAMIPTITTASTLMWTNGFPIKDMWITSVRRSILDLTIPLLLYGDGGVVE